MMRIWQTLAAAAAATLLLSAATAAAVIETKPLNLSIKVGAKSYDVSAQQPADWELLSEGQLSLNQRFDIQPDGSSGTIEVRIAPLPANKKEPNPCLYLTQLAKPLQANGLRVSPGRSPQGNMNPVCSMVIESTLKTLFYYASIFRTADLAVAGIAYSQRDLTDDQIADFSRYLASVQANPKDSTQ